MVYRRERLMNHTTNNSTETRNAIILAAGFGMRMVPINLSTPKGLLEVNGEPLIERLIKQLQDVAVNDITIVVGFMKEKFTYLAEKYKVNLVENPDFAIKNNLSSLALVADRIGNTYILPSDLWCEINPFNYQEIHSWYMVSDSLSKDSDIRINSRNELHLIPDDEEGHSMIGIAYITKPDADELVDRIKKLSSTDLHDDDFWESALYNGTEWIIPGRSVPTGNIFEINTYEQLRDLDEQSIHLHSDALEIIAELFKVTTNQINEITVLKKGMTNRSFRFAVGNNRYIMRIPGEGTEQLIDRNHEAEVFQTISGKGLCDDPVYINPENGYKITRYLEGIRVADPTNISDIQRCMKRLRGFHEMDLKVHHAFDIFGQIEYYETLWGGKPSSNADYKTTKENVLSLVPFIERHRDKWSLTHIDAVPDNFLFYQEDGEEKMQLTDWEYSGMQDPHLDIAMWSVYSFYDKQQIDSVIDIYFDGECKREVRAKIYCYVAAAGLLWSNWCEYKATLGVEFIDYSKKQYQYAKDYFEYASQEIEKLTV